MYYIIEKKSTAYKNHRIYKYIYICIYRDRYLCLRKSGVKFNLNTLENRLYFHFNLL